MKPFIFKALAAILILFTMNACQEKSEEKSFTGAAGEVKLITLAPGHFHAHLVQKSMYDQVNPVVHIYAPEGTEVQEQIARIESYNNREDDPTSWELVVYTGDDYLERMISEKKGNVVVLAGNNRKKTHYIKTAVSEGFNVLSDKPMVINSENFQLLKEAFEIARKNNVLLYDIMTERYEITSQLQKELMHIPGIFGELEKGSPEDPAIIKESVHHFFKYVAGSILRRPPWYFDVNQQGEGIIDVTTHLVDLVQWSCFPEQIIDYTSDIEILNARRWPTAVTQSQYESITRLPQFPDYLSANMVNDTTLHVYANGEMNYTLKGVHARVGVVWDYVAPEGAGDTHYSVARGTKANLVIRQGAEQNFKPVLYIEPVNQDDLVAYEASLREEFVKVSDKFPGVELEKTKNGWKLDVPQVYDVGHEAHFAQVTAKYLQFLVDGKLPEWEVPNMISKYYTTTKAREVALSVK
jgi:predicted dehydrogenase